MAEVEVFEVGEVFQAPRQPAREIKVGETQLGDAPIGDGHAPPLLQRVGRVPSYCGVGVEALFGVLKQVEIPQRFAIPD